MPEYIFEQTVQKPYALDDYLLKNFQYYVSLATNEGEITITTSIELSTEQYEQLSTLMANYVDPEVFLVLNTTTNDLSTSKTTNSATPKLVKTFIQSCDSNSAGGSAVLNAFKSILCCHTDDISVFADYIPGTESVTFDIYDLTRGFQLDASILNIDISSTLNDWKTLAQAGASGPYETFKTFMIQGLRNYLTTYDCIWQFRLKVTNPSVNVELHGLQSLYYDVQ